VINLKLKKKVGMDLLNFKLRLADNLINLGSSAVTKGKGRPSKKKLKNSQKKKKLKINKILPLLLHTTDSIAAIIAASFSICAFFKSFRFLR